MVVIGWFGVAAADTCGAYGALEARATVSGLGIESSGLAASRTRDGVWFTHDDRGGEPALYAFRLDGTVLGTHRIADADHEDWEDLAAGPCPDAGDCLFVGDIGDNDGLRPQVTIYVVREPEEGDDRISTIRRWVAVYPDGPRDAESLLVHPCTGEVSIVTKDADGASEIWRLPAEPDEVSTLRLVATVQLDGPEEEARQAAAADWDPDGDRVGIRTSSRLFEWVADPADPDAHWGEAPAVIALPTAVGGEGFAYDLDGGFVVTSEGDPIPVDAAACEDLLPSDHPCDPPQTGRTCGCDQGAPGATGLALGALAGLLRRRR